MAEMQSLEPIGRLMTIYFFISFFKKCIWFHLQTSVEISQNVISPEEKVLALATLRAQKYWPTLHQKDPSKNGKKKLETAEENILYQ